MRRLAGIALVALLCAPLWAQEDLEAEAKQQVLKLGDTDWATRERAQRRVVAIGEPARKSLREALENTDPEIRVRASKALIAIGETLGYAMEAAKSPSDGIRTHGIAALKHLLHVADETTLRKLSQNEINQYDRGGYSSSIQIQQPPIIALARVEGVSGFHIHVSEQVAETWAKVMETPTLTIYINGDATRLYQIVQSLTQAFNNIVRDPKNMLMVNAMRCGRKDFVYITSRDGQFDAATRCTDQLIAELLAGGPRTVRAAALLGEAAATDPASSKALTEEFLKSPALGPQYWLANTLDGDEKLKAALAAVQPAEIVGLLGSNDWVVIQAAAKALGYFKAHARAKALDARIEAATLSLELVAALWCARGCTLGPAGRERVRKLLTVKQDTLATAAARWLGGAKDISDAELDAIWGAAENLPANSGFLIAALELIGRADIAPRLEARARESITKVNSNATQQALAAAVLKGRATMPDLTQALKRLNGAKDHALAAKLSGLLAGCEALEEEGMEALVAGITDSKADVRRRYLRALRQCAPHLREAIGNRAHKKIVESVTDPAREPGHLKFVRISTDGILAGAGQGAALDRLLQHAEGEKIDLAKEAGRALVDALDAEGLAATLNNLKKKMGIKFGPQVVQEAYKELCLRAVETGDNESFRIHQAKALSVRRDWDWDLQNWLQERQSELRQSRADFDLEKPLPRDPLLTDLKAP